MTFKVNTANLTREIGNEWKGSENRKLTKVKSIKKVIKVTATLVLRGG